LQQIRNNPQTADTYIIMLTSDTEESSLIRGLRRGADDYLMKPLSPSRLLAHIAAIERRLEAAAISGKESGKTNPENNHAELLQRLTQREKELLKLVVQGLSNQQVAEKLIISETTVKNHLASIYRKWDVSNRNQAAFIAQQLKF
jgi:DNA-binding NarL/FixJ family response regulator